MSARSNFRKPLAIATAAFLAAACGSTEPEVTAVENSESAESADGEVPTSELATETAPPEGFKRVTFNFSPADVIDDVYQGDLSSFEVRSASGDETIVIGFLDATGTIDIPNELAGKTIGVEAEFPDDEFCWWSGFYTTNNAALVTTIDVELDEICA